MRRLIILALAASCAFAAYPNLQLAYRFQNTAVDWSGNGRDGTVNGSGVYTTARGQQALYFDGTGDYVATPSFALPSTHTVIVLALSIRCKINLSNYQTFLGDNAVSNTDGLSNGRVVGDSSAYWVYGNGSSTPLAIAANYFAGYNDKWVRVMIVADYAGKNIYFYREGALFTTVAMTGTPVFPYANRVRYVGSYNTTVNLLVGGYLQNVQLWTLATMPPLAVMNASAARIAADGMPCW